MSNSIVSLFVEESNEAEKRMLGSPLIESATARPKESIRLKESCLEGDMHWVESERERAMGERESRRTTLVWERENIEARDFPSFCASHLLC